MAILPIIEIPDPRLRLVSEPVEGVTDEVRTLIADMFETMYDAPGIGLAAIQVAVPKRVLVIDLQEQEDEEGKPVKAPKAFVNPVIEEVSDELSTYQEGCLSIPEQYAEVVRPARCRVTWLDE
jgi:peptide deformylase